MHECIQHTVSHTDIDKHAFSLDGMVGSKVHVVTDCDITVLQSL